MASLVQSSMNGSINIYYTRTNGLYVIQFLSESYMLQYNTKIDEQVISNGELVAKAQYPCSVQENIKWYWKQQPLQKTITVPTRTILFLLPDVITIKYFQDIPKNVSNRIQF